MADDDVRNEREKVMTERDRESDDAVVIRNLSKVSYTGGYHARV